MVYYKIAHRRIFAADDFKLKSIFHTIGYLPIDPCIEQASISASNQRKSGNIAAHHTSLWDPLDMEIGAGTVESYELDPGES
jgi:hypothetical protein